MATGRIRRSARRGLAVAVLGWLGAAAVAVVLAPGASAAPTATVPIRDLTVPTVHVDAGGSVTFVNQIQDKTVQVGGGGLLPTLVSVTARTEVSLTLPSGPKALAPGASVTEKFASSCVTCAVTFTYELQSNTSLTAPLTNAALGLLPPLPAPTPFVVNTLVPLPNLEGRNLPQLPPVTVPLPPLPGTQPPPAGPLPPGPGTDQPPASVGDTPGGPPAEGIPGSQYTYNTGAGAPQLKPADVAAAAAFDPSRFHVPGKSLGGVDRNGSGGVVGSYDGASVPVFGQLAGLDGATLDDENAELASAGSEAPAGHTLPAAALAAVVALAAVTAGLVRTHQAARASR